MGRVFNDGDDEGREIAVPLNAFDHFLVRHSEFGGVLALEEGGQNAVHAVGVDDSA